MIIKTLEVQDAFTQKKEKKRKKYNMLKEIKRKKEKYTILLGQNWNVHSCTVYGLAETHIIASDQMHSTNTAGSQFPHVTVFVRSPDDKFLPSHF